MQQEGASVGVMDITSSYDMNKCFIRIIEEKHYTDDDDDNDGWMDDEAQER